MDFLIFLTGFAAGAIAVFLLSYFVKKQNDRFNKTAFEQMKLQFENTANKLLKESSKSLSDENRERLEDFFLRFKDKIEAFERRNEENSIRVLRRSFPDVLVPHPHVANTQRLWFIGGNRLLYRRKSFGLVRRSKRV